MNSRYSEIPEELRSLPNWVCWRLERRANKAGVVRETKVPYSASSGKLAKSNNPSTWSSFGDAAEALKRGYNGLGFCLTPPYVGVDLDGCRENGADEPWAEGIIRELDSYSELSPSGHGVHVMVKGELPDGQRQKDMGGEHHGIGLYDAARGRYLTMTGARIRGNGVIAERTAELRRIHARLFPPKPKAKPKPQASAFATDDDLIERARKANDGGKFARLFDGQWEGDYASQSEADLALCMKLAFWTDRDAGRIDALFRRSGLMREKWNRREDYRERTIAEAMERTTETWRPRGPDRQSWTVPVDVDRLAPTIDALNACAVFGGRIHFLAVERRGPMIVARFAGVSGEAVWPSLPDLISFTHSQAILAEVTQVLIPTPTRRAAKALWEPTAQLILRLAGSTDISTTDSLRDEFRHIILSTWKRAGGPHAWDEDVFLAVMRECVEHKREPQAAQPPRCCVWHDSRYAYVHQPSLIEWLSTPAARNKHYDWAQVRNALLLLGFTAEQVHRSSSGVSAKVRLWRGPMELLVDDET